MLDYQQDHTRENNPPSLRSPSRHHHDCTLVYCDPFGHVHSCVSHRVLRLSELATKCHAYLPSLLTRHLFASADVELLESTVDRDFSLPGQFDDNFYPASSAHIKRLQELSLFLSSVNEIQNEAAISSEYHDPLPSDILASITAQNLCLIHECVMKRKSAVEIALWAVLDDFPDRTEAFLSSFMNMDVFAKKLDFLPFASFQTLGVGRWLGDDVINYFVKKWCSQGSTTLGLNSFFACKILFQNNSCVRAKTGVITQDVENTAVRWCLKAKQYLGLRTWDSVFIPINKNSLHWYCAHIDFQRKSISIYDSLRDRCLSNRQKPVSLRKNTNLMLVLMWLTEVLGHLRGEDVDLKNNSQTDWVFFQPNSYDCGVHTLWHLQHVLKFRHVLTDNPCPGLAFTHNMVGKRLRMAQEIYDDYDL
ncbi:hypothetical protein D9757_014939 [Collybiopsis confluens]|uniref:Ubiquitin-like protease family profile domain-containing protein n=1 Tax=Collybiopsis confluens TaxID=2823264 RepID=A0A8H5CKM5_9AGAR|nr:hypothetical protein D9757_014939 [Collybiopsis confluens]